MEKKERFICEMFERGVLISQDFLDSELNNGLKNEFEEEIKAEKDLMVLTSDYAEIIKQQTTLVDWYELDLYRVEAEKERNEELYQNELQQLKKTSLVLIASEKKQEKEFSGLETELKPEKSGLVLKTALLEDKAFDSVPFFGLPLSPEQIFSLPKNQISSSDYSSNSLNANNPVEVIISYENEPSKYKVSDFTSIFVSRYKFLENILRNRQELQSTLTISRILGKKEKGVVSVIGAIDEISITKSGHLVVTIEDLTGKIKVLISKNNKELFLQAKELVLDEVIGAVGTSSDKIIFLEKIIWPDLPENKELKTGETEGYAIFLSDIHYGSKNFLKNEFNKFLFWINGQMGNEQQKSLAEKTSYIFIAGDLVDGVGEYPSQEEDLEIKDIREQYRGVTNLIQQIPTSKKIIICPGNHDLVHLAEPQPIFYKEYAPELLDLPNVTFISNPGVVNIAKTKKSSGLDVLLYHGYCFDYYVANVESIRNNGGYHRADLLMKFLLKRRHLAPSFKSTPYFPGHKEDPLLIKKIPDIFLTGHIHYSKVANYKGVTLICGSCWQNKTSFQEKLGHEPEPARVPLVNLKTREVKILKFI